MKKQILLVAINAKYIHSNLAVYSLKAYAKANGEKENSGEQLNIEIAEYTINNATDGILSGIYEKKPDVVCFSCYIWNIEIVKKLIPQINKILPGVHIFLGGPEVTYNYKDYIAEYPYIAGVMCKEGEGIFKDITDRVVRGIDYENIPGLATGQTEPSERENLDMSQIPFPYKDLKEFENRIIYYETSRGCPYKCSYCLSSVDKRLRFRSMEQVKEELAYFINNRVKQVKFVDRTFNADKKRTIEILRYIQKKDNNVTNFHFEISAELIDDQMIEVFNSLRPGLVQLEIGVQTFNDRTIQAIRRKMDKERLKYVVKKLREPGNIHIHLDLIAGLPFEDIESFKESFNEVYGLRPHELQLGFLKVLHGAYMYEDAKEYNIVYADYPPYEVISTPWLTYGDILRLKSIEEVVEIYYGSRQFDLSISYLERYFETPFDLYDRLGVYYKERSKGGESHSRQKRYHILKEFAVTQKKVDMSVFTQLLAVDMYSREHLKQRPDFLQDIALYREEIKETARQNGLRKDIHIEVVSEKTAKIVIGENEKVNMLAFDYSRRDIITNNVKCYGIKSCRED